MSSNPLNKAVKAVWNLKKTVPLAGRLMIDPRVARSSKLIFVFVSVGYLLFPYDFIFDFPFFGQFDDLAVVVMMLNWFIRTAPEAVLKDHGWDGKEVTLKKNKKQVAKTQDHNKIIYKITGRRMNENTEEKPSKKLGRTK